MSSPPGAPPTPRRALFATGFLTFVLIGATQAFYGPAFPAFRERFGVPLERVGDVVSAHFLGSFLTIAAAGWLIRRFGYPRLLAAAAALMAVGSAGVASAPSWSAVLAATFVIGLGYGILDVAVNLLYARSFGDRAAPTLNLLNALFGVGAVVGPLLVAAALPRVGLPFAVAAGVAAVLVPLWWRMPAPEPLPPAADALPVSWGRVGGFVLLYFLYVASEVGVASWETEHLGPVFGPEAAASFTAIYWAALTVGRFVAAPLSARLRPRDLVLGSSVLALAAVTLAHVTPFAPAAYALAGFAFAPIFPTGLAWLAEVFPRRSEQITPIAIAAANLGPVLSAPAIAAVVGATSPARVPTVLSLVVAGLVLTVTVLWGRTRRS